MAGLAGNVLVNALCHGLLHLGMAVLAGGPALDVAHAAGSGLVAVHALHLLLHMHVLGKPCRFGEFLAQIAVAAPPLHGPRVADKGAPAAARAVRRRRDAAERVATPLAGRRIVTVEAARVAEIAGLLLGDRLIMRKGLVDLFDDLCGVLEGELVAFSPADRQGVRKGRPSIVRAVDIVPRPHGPLAEVRAHDARVELRHLVGMAGGLAAGLLRDCGVVAEGDGIRGHATSACPHHSQARPSHCAAAWREGGHCRREAAARHAPCAA